MIRSANLNDAQAVCDIYNPYVTKTVITFEESPVAAEEMKARIAEVTSEFPWLVYEENKRVVGYAYASRWKSRSAYRFSVESTVYVDSSFAKRGIGTLLYLDLLEKLREINIHSVVGCIALPNDPSVRLHEKLGFENVARFKEVGWKFEQWIDVGYWQKNFGK